MSLVNDMLRDLDARRDGAAQAQVPGGLVPPSSRTTALRVSRYVLGLVILVGAGMLLLWWLAPDRLAAWLPFVDASGPAILDTATPGYDGSDLENAAAGDPAPVLSAASVSVVSPSEPAVAAPAVTALEWRDQGGALVLVLQGSEPLAFERLELDEQRLRLRLPGFALESRVPPLPGRLVRALSFNPDAAGLALELQSRRPVDFGIESGFDHPARLQIRIQGRPATPQPVASAGARAPDRAGASARTLVSDRAVASDRAIAADKTQEPAKAPNENKAPLASQPTPRASTQTSSSGDRARESSPQPSPQPAPQENRAMADQERGKPAPEQSRVRPAPSADEALVQDAREHLRRSGPKAALAWLQDRLVTSSGTPSGASAYWPQSRQLAAELALSQKNPELAAELLAPLETEYRQETGLRALRARILLRQERADQALALLERDLPGPAVAPAYHQLLAAVQRAVGHHSAAARSYHQLLREEPTLAVAWLGLGLSLEALQETRGARRAYLSLLEIPGVDAGVRTHAERRLRRLQD